MSILTTDAVVVDALPYIDHGYDEPGVREAALAMVEEETRRYRPTKNYLDHLPALNLTSFETELMKTEFERLSNRQAMNYPNVASVPHSIVNGMKNLLAIAAATEITFK